MAHTDLESRFASAMKKGERADKKGLKRANSFAHAATKALHSKLKTAGRRDYELEAETKHK